MLLHYTDASLSAFYELCQQCLIRCCKKDRVPSTHTRGRQGRVRGWHLGAVCLGDGIGGHVLVQHGADVRHDSTTL